jgi:hypothetical protein
VNNTTQTSEKIFADYAEMNPYHVRMLRYFECDHLPEHLREVSRMFQAIAWRLGQEADTDPAEMSAALRKLLEAKDCAVRAKLGAGTK